MGRTYGYMSCNPAACLFQLYPQLYPHACLPAFQVTYYEDAPGLEVPATKVMGGPSSDILCAAYSEGTSLLAAGCCSGEVWLFNIEASSVRARLLPAGHADLPENERSVEKVGRGLWAAAAVVLSSDCPQWLALSCWPHSNFTHPAFAMCICLALVVAGTHLVLAVGAESFVPRATHVLQACLAGLSSLGPTAACPPALQVVFLHGKLRSVLLAVGADRQLRVWDTVRCCLLATVHTGHKMGESVAAMALDSSGARLATGEQQQQQGWSAVPAVTAGLLQDLASDETRHCGPAGTCAALVCMTSRCQVFIIASEASRHVGRWIAVILC